MSLFLITGLPGTGKSTVYAELKKRGYEAYDGDYDRLAKWYSIADGAPVDASREHDRTPEFLETHSRDISLNVVTDLAARAESGSVFLCADPENEDELVPQFTKVFALVLDENVRQTRLVTRTNNKWGKLPHEVAYDLTKKPIAYDRYERYGYIILDASQPIEIIVDKVLAEIAAVG